nr:hypothetical protein [Candidatus Neomarinimicrobiota bacterium]
GGFIYVSDDYQNIYKYELITWYSYGLDTIRVKQIRKYPPYLYVCGGQDGLWRRNIEVDTTGWEYLGMSVADVNAGGNGVFDVIINEYNPIEILVAYDPYSGDDPSVYKSINDGQIWFPSSEGMDYYIEEYEYHGYYHIWKFQKNSGGLFAVGERLFVSDDFGDSWQDVTPESWIWAIMINDFVTHSTNDSIMWFGGETSFFGPLLVKSQDAGISFQWVGLQVPIDNTVYSIALHPTSVDTLYVALATYGWLIKATDGGKAWINDNNPIEPIFIHPYVGYCFTSIVIDSNNPSCVYVAGGPYIFECYDSVESWSYVELEWPLSSYVCEMFFDGESRKLYVGTLSGVFIYQR